MKTTTKTNKEEKDMKTTGLKKPEFRLPRSAKAVAASGMLGLAAMMGLAGGAVISCENGTTPTTTNTIQREFDIGNGATLKDERSGNPAQLEQAIVEQFTGWLNEAKRLDESIPNNVIARGLVITIKSNVTSQVEVIDRKTVDIDFSFIGNIDQNMFNAIIADIYSRYQSNARSARETVRLAKAPVTAGASG